MTSDNKWFTQKERADEIIRLFRKFEQQGKSITVNRSDIHELIENKYNSCHSCLLLATYGLYKNGFISESDKLKPDTYDYKGFDGKFSNCIAHAIDACKELSKNPDISSTKLKKKFGGDGSIYSFVTAYFKNGLLNL